ncbi:MAG: sigma-70 family RNA polymerase sigma factor [Bryobacteraceae bacterium]|nr:sigma-70 family RNA polymerase sigma factor [Bryobacteraceae bacterium]
MHKTCKIVGRDGKGNGRAWREKALAEALADYLNGRNREAWSFAYGLCRDAEEAGELLQEACYRALKARRRYRGGTRVKSWLFTIMRNAYMDSRRRRRRWDCLSLDFEVESDGPFLYDTLAEPGGLVAQQMERAESAALMRSAVNRLGCNDRQVLRLCDLKRLPYVVVARKLRVPEGTVRTRLIRARAKLRKVAVRLDLE